MTAEEWAVAMNGTETNPMPPMVEICSRILADLAAVEAERDDYHSALEALYDKITDWFEVEDWTDPRKGITEVEAHFNVLDRGMDEHAKLYDKMVKLEAERDALRANEDAIRSAHGWERDGRELPECVRGLAAERGRLRERLAEARWLLEHVWNPADRDADYLRRYDAWLKGTMET